jgi:hypothetical protein
MNTSEIADKLDFLMDTEKQLLKDSDGQYRSELINQLEEELFLLSTKRKSLLSKEEFQKVEAACCALDQALQVLKAIQ